MGVRRVGHGGTLDPAASGLLPVLVGAATKFADRLHEALKVYDAVVRFGRETTTDDREGQTVRDSTLVTFDPETLERGLATLRGVIEQVPPTYSALKVRGRTAYARARAGEELKLAARSVQVRRLDVIDVRPPEIRLLVVCSSGTYVRALARDLGRNLGSAAHLAALRRLAVGALAVEGAITPDATRALGAQLASRLVPPSADLLRLEERYLREPAATIAMGERAR